MANNLYTMGCAVLMAAAFSSHAQIINTFAGTIVSGYAGDGGPAASARLFHPKATSSDINGNVYIADADNNVVRKVDPSGTITTFAGVTAGGYGGNGGPATTAFLARPNGIATDHHGNIYICDGDNHVVRKVNSSGIISTVVGDGTPGSIGDGGSATAAELDFPGGIALDDTGNLYIADEYNNKIRKVDTFGIITTFAGTGSGGYSGEGGPATAADIGFPFCVAVDHSGNVYFTMTLDDRICKINTSHVITTIAGIGGGLGGFSGDGGPATAADFDTPWGISVDPDGNVYIADNANERIRRVNRLTGIVTTIAGTGSAGFGGDGLPATSATLRDPAGVYADNGGRIFIADYNNHRIREVSSPFTHAPSFTGGHSQLLVACNATSTSIDSLMHITDADTGQYETWSIASGPSHGTLSAYYGAVSTGTVIAATGLSYTPVTGYTGADSFRVRIYDGISADTTTVHVSVTACPTELTNVTAENNGIIIPNPCNGEFIVRLSAANNEPVQLVITDAAGRKITGFTGQTNTPLEVHLDAPDGIYMIHATSANGKWDEKLMLIR